MSSSISTCSITLSDFTKKRIPDLNRIFEGIKDQRYKLEIIGVLKVAGGSEDEITLAVTVNTAVPTSVPTVIEPASERGAHNSLKSRTGC